MTPTEAHNLRQYIYHQVKAAEHLAKYVKADPKETLQPFHEAMECLKAKDYNRAKWLLGLTNFP